jgi:hypothetical protein
VTFFAAVFLATIVLGPTPGAASSASPAAPAATAGPTAEPSAEAPQASPSPTPAASPVPYAYRFVPRQPDSPPPGTPQIFAVYLNDKKLRSLGPFDIKVATSPDVVKVVTGSGGQDGDLTMVAPGDFEATSKLPKVPFIAKGMIIYLQVIATGQSGTKTTVRVPVQLQ